MSVLVSLPLHVHVKEGEVVTNQSLIGYQQVID